VRNPQRNSWPPAGFWGRREEKRGKDAWTTCGACEEVTRENTAWKKMITIDNAYKGNGRRNKQGKSLKLSTDLSNKANHRRNGKRYLD